MRWLRPFTQTHGFTNSPCVTCNDLRRIHILNVTKRIHFIKIDNHLPKYIYIFYKDWRIKWNSSCKHVHFINNALYASIWGRMVLWTMYAYLFCLYSQKNSVYLAFSLLRLQKCFDNLKHVLKTLFVQSRCFVSNLILDRTGSVHML